MKVTIGNVDQCRGLKKIYAFVGIDLFCAVDYQSDGSGLHFISSTPFRCDRDFVQVKLRVGRWNDRECKRMVYGEAVSQEQNVAYLNKLWEFLRDCDDHQEV